MTRQDDEAAPAAVPNDPLFGLQWHLLNSAFPGVDLNVVDLWDEYGGRGVLVGVIDDGVDYTHPDLAGNYDTTRDFDARDRDDDAFTSDPGDRHGTAVSGVIAAARDNGTGGSGVAPEARLTTSPSGVNTYTRSWEVSALNCSARLWTSPVSSCQSSTCRSQAIFSS